MFRDNFSPCLLQYDLPDVINFILQQTSLPSLSYVGHSEGTIQMFAALIT